MNPHKRALQEAKLIPRGADRLSGFFVGTSYEALPPEDIHEAKRSPERRQPPPFNPFIPILLSRSAAYWVLTFSFFSP